MSRQIMSLKEPSASQVKRWNEKLQRYLSHFAPEQAAYLESELKHYATPLDIKRNIIRSNPEEYYLKKRCQTPVTMPLPYRLQTPEQTFQEEDKPMGVRCRYCGNTNTTTMTTQTRSSDEPMTNFHFCRDCGRTTKET